jgi:hypothetical protein
LALNPNVWCTEIIWKLLADFDEFADYEWIIGGDFNSSETFDYMWPGGPRGNAQIMERFEALGLRDALREKQRALVPTFKNP